MERCDLVITGGGPAGLAAAVSAWEAGIRDIVVLERDRELLAAQHPQGEQLSLFGPPQNQNQPTREDVIQCLTGQI